MKRISGIIGLVVLAAAVPCMAQQSSEFRLWRSINRAASPQEEIVAAALDSDVYGATRDGFPDLRVLDQAGVETPYQIEAATEVKVDETREPSPSKVVSLKEEGEGIEIFVRLGKESPPADAVEFVTPLVDYERTVLVSGSRDGAEWTPLVTDGVIFDYTRYMDVSSREIRVPKNDYRELKIAIRDVTDAKESPYQELTRTFRGGNEAQRVERATVQRRSFRIDRIRLWHYVARERSRQPKKSDYPVAGFRKEEDADKKQTVIHVRTNRQPLTELAIVTVASNFYRRAEVQVPVVEGVRTQWTTIGEANLYRFEFRGVHREQLAVSFPEHRKSEYRLVIENEDNPPLDITGAIPRGPSYRVVFLGRPANAYRLFYGSDDAQSPKYETGVVLAALGQEDRPAEAALGPQIENAAFGGPAGFTVRKLLDNWVFLGLAIVLMVAVLAYGLYRAGRSLEGMPKE